MQLTNHPTTVQAAVLANTREARSVQHTGKSPFWSDFVLAAVVNSSVLTFMWTLLEFGGKR